MEQGSSRLVRGWHLQHPEIKLAHRMRSSFAGRSRIIMKGLNNSAEVQEEETSVREKQYNLLTSHSVGMQMDTH